MTQIEFRISDVALNTKTVLILVSFVVYLILICLMYNLIVYVCISNVLLLSSISCVV